VSDLISFLVMISLETSRLLYRQISAGMRNSSLDPSV
jgi:hypothetical protein